MVSLGFFFFENATVEEHQLRILAISLLLQGLEVFRKKDKTTHSLKSGAEDIIKGQIVSLESLSGIFTAAVAAFLSLAL